jgi:hypothetical protein
MVLIFPLPYIMLLFFRRDYLINVEIDVSLTGVLPRGRLYRGRKLVDLVKKTLWLFGKSALFCLQTAASLEMLKKNLSYTCTIKCSFKTLVLTQKNLQ